MRVMENTLIMCKMESFLSPGIVYVFSPPTLTVDSILFDATYGSPAGADTEQTTRRGDCVFAQQRRIFIA